MTSGSTNPRKIKELIKLHKAMLDCGSSHAYFFLQQAYDKKGRLGWAEMVIKIEEMIRWGK